MEALQDCVASDGGKQPFANAVAISFGGVPIFFVAAEEKLCSRESDDNA
jgi:hypothetical protein